MRETSPGRPLGAVHLIADLDAFAAEDVLVEKVRPLLEAGLPSLQLRGKGRTDGELVRAGRALREEAERAGCFFVVNGSVAAARSLGADGVHLPARGLDLAEARAAVLEGIAFGRSCHDAAELERAAGAEWVLISPVFPTPSKPGAATLGTEGLRRLAAVSPAPVYALGGVTRANVRAVLRAGAAGVAAIRGLCGTDGLSLLEECASLLSE